MNTMWTDGNKLYTVVRLEYAVVCIYSPAGIYCGVKNKKRKCALAHSEV